MVHVGIDIGTSNTVVAILDNGQPTICPVDGDALVPSVVTVAEVGGNMLVGHDAVNDWADPQHRPDGTFRRWKLSMGENRIIRTMRLGGPDSNAVAITPELLTTTLVEHVLAAVEGGVGGEQVDSVLVTVPHGWRRENPEKCQATRRSAGNAILTGREITVQDTAVSEPVAAAAYWLWQARSASGAAEDEFVGRHILVCDVGGGTFDLSLVRVGKADEPLDVVDAINSDYAGDYATALLIARAAKLFNDEFGTEFDADADVILRQLADAPDATLRRWFMELQQFQQGLSSGIAAAVARGRPPLDQPRQVGLGDVSDPDRSIIFALTPTQFKETLEPFYERGRELLRKFLIRHGGHDKPYAVVFAGGGSRIAGIASEIVRPVLAERDPQGCDAVMKRITMNDRRVDQAIALGAALVANGVVSVQERVLNDIGLEITLDEPLAKALDLSPETPSVLLTPILPRGEKLPAKFSSDEYRFTVNVPAGDSLELMMVIDDDDAEPYMQTWTIAHPTGQSSRGCNIVASADADGVLQLTLEHAGGKTSRVEGRLSRHRTGRVKLQIQSGNESAAKLQSLPRVTPERLAKALSRLRGSDA